MLDPLEAGERSGGTFKTKTETPARVLTTIPDGRRPFDHDQMSVAQQLLAKIVEDSQNSECREADQNRASGAAAVGRDFWCEQADDTA